MDDSQTMVEVDINDDVGKLRGRSSSLKKIKAGDTIAP